MKDINLSVWKYIHIYAICGNNVVYYYYIFLKDAKFFLTLS